MKALVVYESIYGNTHDVAMAIAEGLGGAAVRSVHEAAEGDEVWDLLVVGGPTHIHGMASERSRESAVQAAAKDGKPHQFDENATQRPTLREWLHDLPPCAGRKAAAFDTRIGKARWITGSAARGIARRLEHHGLEVVGTRSFVVAASEGPLIDGELERAREWGKELSHLVGAAVTA